MTALGSSALDLDIDPRKITKMENKQKQDWERKESRTKDIYALPFVFITTLSMAVMGAVAMGSLFSVPLWILIAVGVAGFIVDGFVFYGSVRTAFANIFAKGLFNDLEDFVLQRELTESKNHINANEIELNKFDDQIKKLKASLKGKSSDEKDDIRNRIAELEIEKVRYMRTMLNRWNAKKYLLIKRIAKVFYGIGYRKESAMRMAERWWQKNSKYNMFRLKRSKDPVDQFGYAVENIKNNTFKNELTFKKLLIALGFIFTTVTGFGFACMTFTHALPVFGLIGSLIIFPAAGVAYSFLMYNSISGCIKKNVFRQLLKKLSFMPEEPWDETTPIKDKVFHVVKCGLSLIPIAALLTIGITGTILTAGAWLEASVSFLKLTIGAVTATSRVLTHGLMFGIMMPVKILFSVNHTTGAFGEIVNLAKVGIRNLKKADFKAFGKSIVRNPIRSSLYLAGGLVVAVGFLIHFVADACCSSGEGANTVGSWPGRLFTRAMKFMRINPVQAAVGSGTALETLEHGDFVLKNIKGFVTKVHETVAGVKNWCLEKLGFEVAKETAAQASVVSEVVDPKAEESSDAAPVGILLEDTSSTVAVEISAKPEPVKQVVKTPKRSRSFSEPSPKRGKSLFYTTVKSRNSLSMEQPVPIPSCASEANEGCFSALTPRPLAVKV